MIVAVLALLVAMSAPAAMADETPPESDPPQIDAYWDSDQNIIVATAWDFGNQDDKYHQFKCYLDGGTTLTGTIFIPKKDGTEVVVGDGSYYKYTQTFELALENTDDTGRVCLYKGGIEGSDQTEITSPRGCDTVTVDDPYIPEFTTIAIPAIAILGLVAFYRRKQKK